MRHVVAEATDVLAAAGVGSARADAEQLAAHVADVDRGRLFLIEPADDFYPRFRELVDARARRIPLQHIVGSAAFGPVTLGVGPGVFVPRPETESLLEWALAQPLPERPVIIDLCTGSGALAVALARAWPCATVIAVDDSPEALAYARRNVAGTGVELVAADVTAAGLLAGRDGTVDLIVANPPYIPEGRNSSPRSPTTTRTTRCSAVPTAWPSSSRSWRTPCDCCAAADGWASNTTTRPPPRLPRCSTAAGPSPTSRPGAIWPDGHASSPRRGPGEKLGPDMTTFDCSDPDTRATGIASAVSALRGGRLVVLPTDTVYGIGADAFNGSAVSALLAAKGRGRDMPVPVLVGSWHTIDGLVYSVPGAARELIRAFWPGALSLVVRQAPSLHWDLGDADGTVMLRMPLHPVAIELLREVGPMAVSSANISGQPAAVTAAEAQEQLGDLVEVYLEAGTSARQAASTIVDLTGARPRILRQGPITANAIAGVLGIEAESLTDAPD